MAKPLLREKPATEMISDIQWKGPATAAATIAQSEEEKPKSISSSVWSIIYYVNIILFCASLCFFLGHLLAQKAQYSIVTRPIELSIPINLTRWAHLKAPP